MMLPSSVGKGLCRCEKALRSRPVAPSLLAPANPSTSAARNLPICRVTNTSEEIFRAAGADLKEIEEEIVFDNYQVLNPELGRLENRIGKLYLDELITPSPPDPEETAYWFHTPPGGWNREKVKYKAAEEAPVTWPEPQHLEDDGIERIRFDQLEEGMEVTGTITDIWLYHGAQVDFGAEFDALIPLYQDNWLQPGVREVLEPGVQIKMRIYALRQPGLYRWPVQAELLEPAEILDKLLPAELYHAPINHAWCDEQGWGIEEILEATGRTHFQPTSYYLQPDQTEWSDEIQQAYGYDAPDLEVRDENPLEELLFDEWQPQISSAANMMFMHGM